MKTLIVEFQLSGHYPEYLQHVLTKINTDRKSEDFLIFLNPYLERHLASFKTTPVYNSIHFFDERLAIEYGNFANTQQMAKLIFEQIFTIQKQYAFDHVLFLNLNLVSRNANILNPLKTLTFSFSGIILNSPYRLREKKGNNFLVFKRELPIRLLAANKNCTKIHILNDQEGTLFYKKWSDKIGFIVDPVNINPASSLAIYDYHNIKKEAITFTQIGRLGKYKGTFDIVNAIHKLDPKLRDKIHFLFIGKMNRDLDVNSVELSRLTDTKRISLRDEFISNEDFSAYVEQSNVIIIANSNAENSSGIVNHCLAAKKVVIAPNKGYYKNAFKEYKAVINYDEKYSLKRAIIYTFDNFEELNKEAKKYDNQSFIDSNSSNRFAETLLEHTYDEV